MRTEATYHTNERAMEFLAGSSLVFFELGSWTGQPYSQRRRRLSNRPGPHAAMWNPAHTAGNGHSTRCGVWSARFQ